MEPLIPAVKPGGRAQEIERREIVNGVLYVLRSGCPWRMLPYDLPNWSTVYLYFREWKQAGVWKHVNTALPTDCATSLMELHRFGVPTTDTPALGLAIA